MPEPDVDAIAAGLMAEASARCRANADPLPGPLAVAFAIPSQDAVRPIVAGDFILFKQLNSPLHRHRLAVADYLRQVRAAQAVGDPPTCHFTAQECLDLICQFSMPAEFAAKLLRQGLAEYRAAAARVAARIGDPAALRQRMGQIDAAVAAVFDTVVEYAADTADDDNAVEVHHPGFEFSRRDGLGWWIEYVGRLCRTFGWSRDDVIWQLPMIQGWAYFCWAIAADPWLKVRRVSPGYIAQEAQRLKESCHEPGQP